ncbi:MAG: ribonucleotide reductase N-terminal alpha domain-containing protein, partial [Parasphingorhabdus sp.]
MDFRDNRDSDNMSGSDVSESEMGAEVLDTPKSKAKNTKPASEPEVSKKAAAEAASAKANDEKELKAERDSHSVEKRRFKITQDESRDDLLTDFGKETLRDRYLLPGESYQDLFARVADAYADDQDHAQRLYDAISKLWFMPATPVLSNGGTGRGLPISCYLNSVD